MKIFFIVISIVVYACQSNRLNAQWNQIGDDFVGDSLEDLAGHSVALSGDGNILAVGYPNEYPNEVYGHMIVYENINGTWFPIGDTLWGSDPLDHTGFAVSLNYDGSVVAISSVTNSYGGYEAGNVEVYEYNGSNWIQLGDDMNGNFDYCVFGWSMSLDSAGNNIIIGAPGCLSMGEVYIYTYNGSEWVQKGNSLFDVTTSYFGESVSISANGSIVVIGVYQDNNNTGYVRVYEYDGFIWNQKGSEIMGAGSNSNFGYSVDINSDGSIIAIGSPGYLSDIVALYKYDGTDWSQMGNTILPEVIGDDIGCSVSINPTGNIIACGATRNGNNGMNSGQCRVFELINNYWIQKGDDINGKDAMEFSGFSVSISYDGNTVAIGAPYNDSIGFWSGAARVYHNCCTSDSISVTACSGFLSPSGNYLWTETGLYYDTLQNAAGCDSIIMVYLTGSTTSGISILLCDASSYVSPSGNYIWTSSGIYSDTIPNAIGCDSIITVSLILDTTTYSLIDTITCDQYISPGGNTFSASGTYMDTLQNTAGCDSIVTINLTVNQLSDTIIYPESCFEYVSPSGQYTWNVTGMYTDTIPNIFGCDSIINIDLIINTVDTSITKMSDTLTSNEYGAIYQWVDCDASYAVIPGEINQFFIAVIEGNYAVIISQNGCIDTSGCYYVDWNNISDLFIDKINIFYNPFTSILTVEGNSISNIELIDMDGRIQFSTKPNTIICEIHLTELSKGIYCVKVVTRNGIHTKRVLK